MKNRMELRVNAMIAFLALLLSLVFAWLQSR